MTYVLSPPGTYRIVSGFFVGTVAPSPGEVITMAGIAVSATENVWPCPLVYEIVYEPPVVTAGTMPSYQAGPAMGSLYFEEDAVTAQGVVLWQLDRVSVTAQVNQHLASPREVRRPVLAAVNRQR
jgi:hypothetical protein